MKFSDCTFRKPTEYLTDSKSLVDIKSYGPARYVELINRIFCGGKLTGRDEQPHPNSTPEIACTNFVDFCMSRYFPIDGSWITFKFSEDPNTKIKEKKLLDMLRCRLADSNFYQSMSTFIRGGVLFNLGACTVNWQYKSLHFNTFTVFDTQGTIIRMSGDALDSYGRGYIESNRNLAALKAYYEVPSYKFESEKRTMDVLGSGNIAMYQTTQCFLPLSKEFITVNGKVEPYERFFMIELDSTGQEILKPKNDVLPVYSTFPIFLFRPALSRSMGEEAVGPAYELINMVYQFRDRVRYVNNPSSAIPTGTLSEFKDQKGNIEELFTKPQVIPISDTSAIKPEALKLPNELPVDMNYVQKLEHDVREAFKASLIQGSRTIGLSAPEHAQMELGVHREIAGFLGSVLTRTAKNLLLRSDTLLRQGDKEYEEASQGISPEVITNSFLDNIEVYKRIKNAATMLEFASGLASVDQTIMEKFNAHKALDEVSTLLELPHLVRTDEEVQEMQKGYQQMSPMMEQKQVDEAKAEKDRADANLKNQQAQALPLQGGF